MATTIEDRLINLTREVREVRRLVLTLSLENIDIMGLLEDVQAQVAQLQTEATEARADADRGRALSQQIIAMLQDQATAIASLQTQLANASPATIADLQAIKDSNQQALDAFAAANITRDETDASLAAVATPTPPTP